MQKQIQIPQFICISDKTTYKYNFDDSKLFQSMNLKISGFRIGFQKSKLCGISFLYKQSGARAVFGNYVNYFSKLKIFFFIFIYNLKSQDKINYHDFIIDDDDYIQIIFGYFKKVITQFGVITYKGIQVSIGQDLGEKFKYLYMGFTFTAAVGFQNYEGGLESLGFQIQKLPKEQLQAFFSPLAELLYPNDFINNNFINQSTPQFDQNNNQEIQPFCEKIPNQQISQSSNANPVNQINYGQNYGVQSMVIIQTEIKKQNIKDQTEEKSNTSFTGNVPEKLFIVLIGCALIHICCKTIKDKINHDEDKEGYRNDHQKDFIQYQFIQNFINICLLKNAESNFKKNTILIQILLNYLNSIQFQSMKIVINYQNILNYFYIKQKMTVIYYFTKHQSNCCYFYITDNIDNLSNLYIFLKFCINFIKKRVNMSINIFNFYQSMNLNLMQIFILSFIVELPIQAIFYKLFSETLLSLVRKNKKFTKL